MLSFQVSEDKKWLLLINSTDDVEKRQIELSLTKKINNFYFHPLVKKKLWDGNICFVDKKGPFWRVPLGLWSEVYAIGKEYDIDIKIEGLDQIILKDFTLEEFQEWVDAFFADKEIKPRDYQVEAAWKIIKFRYSISEIATSSGKTLISFMIFAYLKSKGYIRKFLMIVPNTNLVFQGTEDFDEYGLADLKGSKIQQIGGGNKVKSGCDVIIGTYQSLVKKGEDFFDEVDAVFVDEAHHTNSMSIKKIVSKCMDSGWRFGLTGTLTKRGTADYLTIQQFLGPLVVEISPKFLFDQDHATPVDIKVIIMDWLDSEYKEKLAELKSRKNMEGSDLYNLEKKLVVENRTRLNFVVDFISKATRNSLVLFHSVKDEYGKQIWNLLRQKNKNKEVFYVDGDTQENLREEYKNRMASGKNKILVASYGTFSTGISINNLHNIFLVESYKSETLIKQSLGRGMRKMEGKDVVNIIDFVDNFSTNSFENYLMKHSKSRIEIYKREKFKYKVYHVKL